MKKKEIVTYTIDDTAIQVLILRKKIKNTYIRIDDDFNLVVSTNAFTSKQSIFQLIDKHAQKINQILKQKKQQALPDHLIRYLGRELTFTVQQASRFHYELKENHLILYSTKPKEEAVEQFYKKQASIIFKERFDICFSRFKTVYPIPYPEMTIRKMKSRFGTCYYKKNKVVLNVRLMEYETKIMDYVIYHELAHFIHPNHSPQFYKCLALFEPNHLTYRKELKK